MTRLSRFLEKGLTDKDKEKLIKIINTLTEQARKVYRAKGSVLEFRTES